MIDSRDPPEEIPLTHDDATSYTPPAAFGPFRVLHQIGSGVLGPVFRTYEPGRDRLVAVKVFLVDLLPEQAQQLAEELQGLVEIGLDHPSIVAPLSAGLQGHTVYLAQEYIAAESLDIALRHLVPAPVRRTLPLLRQLAGALDFARARGVGHGALHPRDVFVAPEITKATGFGIVQALERLGVRAPVRRAYSAIERTAGGEWSTPADVYALAAVAHELLTGKRPAGLGEAAPLTATDAGPYADQLRMVLQRALAEDPSARYANAGAFVDDFEAASLGTLQEPAAARELAVVLDVDTERYEEVGEFDRNLADAEATKPAADRSAEHVRLDTQPAGMTPGVTEAGAEAEVAAEAEVEATAEEETEAPRGEEPGEPEPWLFDVEDERAPEAARHPAETTSRTEDSDDATAAPQPISSVAAEAMIEEPYERRRPTMVSFVAVALVCLAAGFLAGYGIGSRQSRPAVTAAPPTSPAPSAEPPAQQAWSEAAVEAPRPAPPVAVPAPEPPTPAESAPPAVKAPTRAASMGVAPSRPTAPPRTSEARRSATPPPRAGEASRAPTPPAVGTGSLSFESRPAGARVVLDGRAIGKTPVKLAGVKAGSHTVRFELDGYRPWTAQVTAVGGRETRVAGSLERLRNR